MANSKVDAILEKISLLYDKLKTVLLVLLVITIGFALFIPRVKVLTIFSDLLPQGHNYIKTYNKYKNNFGGANFIVVSVKVNNGDIYSNKYFEKVAVVTDAIHKLENIDHDSVISLTSSTLRAVELSPDGVLNVKTIRDMVPQDESQMGHFKDTIHRLVNVYGPIVSFDDKSSLIMAGFYEVGLNYKNVHKSLDEISKQLTDENTTIYVSGYPMLMGWIYHYRSEMFILFGVSMFIILFLTLIKFQSFYFTLVPVITLFTSLIWGLGVVGILNINLDPLLFLIPLLLSSRAISHSTQVASRYVECMEELGDNIKAAKKTWMTISIPAIAGIVADAIGIYLLCLTGIPFLNKVGIYCGLWALLLIVNVIFLTPALLALFGVKAKKRNTVYKITLSKIASISTSKVYVYGNLIFWAVLAIIAIPLFLKVDIGDTSPGSPLLRPNSKYNQSAFQINRNFFGDNKLMLHVSRSDNGTMKDPVALRTLDDFSRRFVSEIDEAGGSKSITDIIKYINKMFHSNDPKWSVIPNREDDVGSYMFQYSVGAGVPGVLKEYADDDVQHLSVVVYFKDSLGTTIEKAITNLEGIKKDPKYKMLKVEVMGGNIGVFAAMNEYLKSKKLLLETTTVFGIFIIVLLSYRNPVVCLISIIPVLLGNIFTLAFMKYKEIGVSVSTLPVISIGAGIGIDYTIYMVDRLLHEYELTKNGDFSVAESLRTTGRAVLFTATTMILSLIVWYFGNIRFIAEMGMLLSVMLFVHASTALLLVPSMLKVFYFKRSEQTNIVSEEIEKFGSV